MCWKIDILLSTYNGERFLVDQIESILSQTYVEWRLLIRDDGSKDRTHDIIEEYQTKYPKRIKWINQNNVHNVGVIKSFEELMYASDAEYFMFCDQDDVWLPFKVAETIEKLQSVESKHGHNIPIVVHTDLQVVDGDLNVLSPSMFAISKSSPQIIHSRIQYALLCNCITGCTLMGNKKAKENAIPFPSYIEMHDSWVARKVWLDGGVVKTLFKPTMLYRQHGYNVVGATPSITLKQRWAYLKKCYYQYRLLYTRFTWFAPITFLYYKCLFKVENKIKRSKS